MLESIDAPARLRALFDGEPVNATEAGPALHTALRSDLSAAPVAREAHAQAQRGARMRAIVQARRAAGSPTSSALASAARTWARGWRSTRLQVRRAAGSACISCPMSRPRRTTRACRPRSRAHRRPAGVQELRHPGDAAQRRDPSAVARRRHASLRDQGERGARGRDVRHPARTDPADVGLGRRAIFVVVGGRLGDRAGDRQDGFEALLAGAAEMDAHVLAAPLRTTSPPGMRSPRCGTATPWASAARGAALRRTPGAAAGLPAATGDGEPRQVGAAGRHARGGGDTVPIWWGGAGTDSRHSFFQALHRAPTGVPVRSHRRARAGDPHADSHDACSPPARAG